MKVRIVQCLCPDRHCMTAMAYQTEDGAPKPEIAQKLKAAVADLLERKVVHPWCALCRAPASSFFYEDKPTIFRTMEEAMPSLLEGQKRQAAAQAFFRASRN